MMVGIDGTENDLATTLMELIEDNDVDYEEAFEALVFTATFLLASFTGFKRHIENAESCLGLVSEMYEFHCGCDVEPANIQLQ